MSQPENPAPAVGRGAVCSSPLPCPHCGGPAELRRYALGDKEDERRFFFACARTECHFTYTDKSEALAAWNRRTAISALEEVLRETDGRNASHIGQDRAHAIAKDFFKTNVSSERRRG